MTYDEHLLRAGAAIIMIFVKGYFALPPKDLKFENYLLPFELLLRKVYESSDEDDSLLHLNSKIKDVRLSSYRV